MTETPLRVFLALYKRKKLTIRELANICECSTRTVMRAIDCITPFVPLTISRGRKGGVELTKDYEI